MAFLMRSVLLRRTPRAASPAVRMAWVATALLAVAVIWPVDAMAQGDPPAPSTATSSTSVVPAPAASSGQPQATTLGAVTVTANRRRQPAWEVPMHVDAVSARHLAEQGAGDLSAYVATQPNVVFDNEGGPGRGKLIMRGVSTGNETSPTVAEYIDDVPVGGSTVYASSASFVFDPALLDIDHVEFLYGPQGTLYGAGSMGGLVKFVTKKPDADRFHGYVGFGLSDTLRGGLNHQAQAMVNIPLKKNMVAMRVSLLDKRRVGVYRAVGDTPAQHANDSHTQGGRIQIQAKPTSKLTFNLSATGQTISSDGFAFSDYNLAGQTISGGPYNRELNHREPYQQTLLLYAFHADYDFGFATLEWTSAYQKFRNRAVLDYPDGFINLFNVFGPSLGVTQKLKTLYVPSAYDVHKSSQEIRLVSTPNKVVDWLVGVWFTREDVWEHFALQGANLPPPVGSTRLLHELINARYNEYAGYGNVTWHVTPTFDFNIGVRGSGNSQTLSSYEDGPVAGSPGGFVEHTNAGDVTGLLSAKYHPVKGRSLYFRAATGYRPGGLQAPVTATIIGANPNAKRVFQSDSLQSYEIGYKGTYFDGHLGVGVDGYDIEWKNMQLYTFLLGNAIIVNAGDARINGLEFKLSGWLGNWQLNMAAALTDARTIEPDPSANITDGAQLPYSARRTLTLGVRYSNEVGGTAFHIGANMHASSHRNAGFDNDPSDPNFSLPGYALVNLYAGVTLDGGSGTRINLFVRNLFDRRVPNGTLNTETINFLASLGGPMLVNMTRPRTVGVSVRVPF